MRNKARIGAIRNCWENKPSRTCQFPTAIVEILGGFRLWSSLNPKSTCLIAWLLVLAVVLVGCATEEPEPVDWQATRRELSPDEVETLRRITKDVISFSGEKTFEELVIPQMARLFPDTSFYLPTVPLLTLPYQWDIIPVREGRAYILPDGFNRLLADAGVQVTDANQALVARAFIWLAYREFSTDLIRFERPVLMDEPDLQLPEYRYQLEIRSWTRQGGQLVNWKFGFKEGRIEIVLRTVLDNRVGDYSYEHDYNGAEFSHYKASSGYYICCDEFGRLMRSDRGRITLASEADVPIDCSIHGGGGWIGKSGYVDENRLIEQARQAYPDRPIDERSLFIGTRDHAMDRFAPFPAFTFHLISPPVEEPWSAPVSYAGVLAVEGEKTWRLPEEFNLFLKDIGVQITDANRAEVARAFVWAAHRELAAYTICFTEARIVDEVAPRFPAYRYQLEFQSQTGERGVLVDWKFGFQEGQVAIVRASVLGRFTGTWFSHLHPYVIDPFFEDEVKYYVCCDGEGLIQ